MCVRQSNGAMNAMQSEREVQENRWRNAQRAGAQRFSR
jgi:hypothetical protein